MTATGNRSRAEIDGPDRQLMELLTRDGRASTRSLAAEVGLAEATVAVRVRALLNRRLIGVTAVLDWVAAGWGLDVWLAVEVRGRPVAEVGADLAALPGVRAVHVLFGPVDLLVHVLLADTGGLAHLVDTGVRPVAGVHRIHPGLTLETVKFTTTYAWLAAPTRALDLPSPTIPLDDTDRALVEALIADGRRSNRQIARGLTVSEGTVRSRLRRLEAAGLLRILGQSDPFRTGLVRGWAFVGVDVRGRSAGPVARRLAELPEVVIVARTAGRHPILAMVAAPDRSRLTRLVLDDIRGIDGVDSTETWDVVRTLGLNRQWARLL